MQPVVVLLQHLPQFPGIAGCIKWQRFNLLTVMPKTTIKVIQKAKTDRLALQIDALPVDTNTNI